MGIFARRRQNDILKAKEKAAKPVIETKQEKPVTDKKQETKKIKPKE